MVHALQDGFSPTIEKLAKDYAGKVKVGKVDTDSCATTAIKYSISNIPTVILFNGGEMSQRFRRPPPRKRLQGSPRRRQQSLSQRSQYPNRTKAAGCIPRLFPAPKTSNNNLRPVAKWGHFYFRIVYRLAAICPCRVAEMGHSILRHRLRIGRNMSLPGKE